MHGYRRRRARPTKNRPTPHQFVEAWQTSSTVAQVASKLGMKRAQVRVRACRYRQHGVPLKPYEPAPLPEVDWEEVAQYAEDLVAGDEEKVGAEGAA